MQVESIIVLMEATAVGEAVGKAVGEVEVEDMDREVVVGDMVV